SEALPFKPAPVPQISKPVPPPPPPPPQPPPRKRPPGMRIPIKRDTNRRGKADHDD
ncbi:MAG: hypothetical protein HQ461_02050, partial [Deltaproteobacteria bacterium]|nr:hypothetical protein [Deltaproteobacteria bacterium]